jgi:hypothetical protein
VLLVEHARTRLHQASSDELKGKNESTGGQGRNRTADAGLSLDEAGEFGTYFGAFLSFEETDFVCRLLRSRVAFSPQCEL